MFNSRRLVEVAPLEVVWVLLAFSGWLKARATYPASMGWCLFPEVHFKAGPFGRRTPMGLILSLKLT